MCETVLDILDMREYTGNLMDTDQNLHKSRSNDSLIKLANRGDMKPYKDDLIIKDDVKIEDELSKDDFCVTSKTWTDCDSNVEMDKDLAQAEIEFDQLIRELYMDNGEMNLKMDTSVTFTPMSEKEMTLYSGPRISQDSKKSKTREKIKFNFTRGRRELNSRRAFVSTIKAGSAHDTLPQGGLSAVKRTIGLQGKVNSNYQTIEQLNWTERALHKPLMTPGKNKSPK